MDGGYVWYIDPVEIELQGNCRIKDFFHPLISTSSTHPPTFPFTHPLVSNHPPTHQPSYPNHSHPSTRLHIHFHFPFLPPTNLPLIHSSPPFPNHQASHPNPSHPSTRLHIHFHLPSTHLPTFFPTLLIHLFTLPPPLIHQPTSSPTHILPTPLTHQAYQLTNLPSHAPTHLHIHFPFIHPPDFPRLSPTYLLPSCCTHLP
ncbi:hypothetical protein Pmani_029545 [Petrolisthes manimaculis]|uniref:Uncharacterized protein n=1 Tax=Petrolisthes manimaculis TaxID=1843537 RepID=A0AAE1NZT5_9EUCA|nr:hypothetical protein Pmani_029545 [Petrolisthes manimaculis]